MFKKAEKSQTKIKLALTGPSGSGKTYSSLLIAQGLGNKIALIDTENSSASLYSDLFNFDTLSLVPPFTTESYLKAIDSAVQANYDVLIIDSITHAWAGEGGLLEKKEKLDSSGRGNSYTNWASITKEHEAFKSKLLQSNINMICTMRSKQDYVLQTNDKGKTVPIKVGLAPIQREGMEYEFTIVLDIDMKHNAVASKDRTGLFDNQIFKIDQNTGQLISKWLDGTKPQVTTKTENKPESPPEPPFFDANEPIPDFPNGIPTREDNMEVILKDIETKLALDFKGQTASQIWSNSPVTATNVSKEIQNILKNYKLDPPVKLKKLLEVGITKGFLHD